MFEKEYVQTEEHREKIRLSQLGKPRPQTTGKANGMWKGENSKYGAHHMWIVSKKGKPMKCEHCGIEGLRPRQYHWANKDHKYSRNEEDYIRLCASCHQKYDIENNGYCGGKRKKAT